MPSAFSVRLVAGPGMRRQHRGALDVVYSSDAPKAARRFEQVQLLLLRGGVEIEDPAARLAACLVAFDGIVTRQSLLGALGGCQDAYRWRDAICTEWSRPCGRTDRRHLSVWTRFVLAHPKTGSASPVASVTSLDQGLRKGVPLHLGQSYDLDTFLNDGQAWLALVLAGPWLAHAVDAAPLAALPQSALAREASGKALQMFEQGVESPDHEEMADRCIGRALDCYLEGDSADGSSWLVDQVMRDCAHNATRREMVKNLLTTAATDNKGQLSSLILAWACDLAESGTPRERDISPRTVSKYVRTISRDLLLTFRGKAMERIESKEFDAAYRDIIESKPDGVQRTAASALSSWHAFLECWLEVEPRMRSLYRDLPEAIPKANVIWPHEAETVDHWLILAGGDSREVCQTRVAFAIARTIRVRTNELLKLRLKNVREIDGAVELEICTPSTDGGLKSDNARRVQIVESPSISVLLTEWKARRKRELAMPNDYLFGDPHRPGKPYRLGQMSVLINRMLKKATGDHSVSLHTLSHGWATREAFDAIREHSRGERNRFDAMSADAGHGDASTTFVHYVHRFEEAIRRAIDDSLAERIRWPEMAAFVALEHDSYRQRISRYRRGTREMTHDRAKLELLHAASPTLLAPEVTHRYRTCAATSFLLEQADAQLGLNLIIAVLGDIALGIPEDVVALRSCLSTAQISMIAHIGRAVLSELGEWHPARRTLAGVAPVEDVKDTLERAAHGRINFLRVGQRKLLKLRTYLAANPRHRDIRDSVESWLACYRRGYVDLSRPAKASGLVWMLAEAGTSSSEIGIVLECNPCAPDTSLDEDIDAVFAQNFAVLPLKRSCSPRGGRPVAYLTIAGIDFAEDSSSATLCMTGFNALLLAATVLSRIAINEAPS